MMPYRSKAQRGWMHANKPKIAAEWDKKYGGKIVKKKTSICYIYIRRVSPLSRTI